MTRTKSTNTATALQSTGASRDSGLVTLVVRSQLGDMGAFCDLVRRYQRMAFGYAYARVGDFHLAEDITQEAFADSYLRMRQLREAASFPSWLRSVVRKHADRITRKRREVPIEIDGDTHVDTSSETPERRFERAQDAAEVRALIDSLPTAQREAATLCYIDGCRIAEIAAFLGVREATVRKRLHDARKSLSKHYAGENTMQTEERLKELFTAHLSPEMVRKVMEEPELLNLRGEYRELSFVFVDVVDATAAMRVLSAEETIHYFNEYFTAVQQVVLDSGGFMDKIIGDAVVAFWGAPLPTSGHASAACSAALGIREAVRRLSDGWSAGGKPRMQVGIGVNTGEALIGNLGSPLQLSYTPLGDAVNLGSRMERESRVHGVDIVASEFTVSAAGDEFETRKIASIDTKMRKEPVALYELVG